ncbi:sulfite exporter TauE/SafE family protein [Ornithinimicrobium sufpigmenti]|uniref:sulfite exporter TauE/SafE family protein n=1 Tax=Ornithinimicrobium sufpigmenti TaxID=2508882 RepID=UPI001036E24D|nr:MULTISPECIES: sulfite exporter TauE/SafE family protein [unclassified Ornithinimicrobium]
MAWSILLLVLGCVVLGAVLQRVSGMGMGLVSAPTLSLVLGPVAGVTLSNVAAVTAALVLTVVLRRDIDWRRFRGVAPLLLVGSVVGALVVRTADTAVLDTVLGTTVLVAIAAALGLQRHLNATGRLPALTSGALAGFMNTTAGVAGPAMTVYAVASRWDHRSFAATLQPVFLMANGASIITKALAGATPPADLVPWGAWVVAVAAVPVGIGAGTVLARRVSLRAARTVALTVAMAGGVVALVRGVLGLVS